MFCFVYFPISSVSPTHNNDISPLKIITCSHCTFTQITTQLSAGPTVSLQFLWVHCLLLSHQKQSSVSDCPQMIHIVTCFVSVIVCSLLLCPLFIDFFLFFTQSVCFFPYCTASISPLALPPVLAVSLHSILSQSCDIVLRTVAVG